VDTPGVVELRSGVGFFWMRGYLIVSDHPYVAITGRDGGFRLGAVPPGEYELVVSHPSWRVAGIERDVDNLRVCQVEYGPWLEMRMPVRVVKGEATRVEAALGAP
jgi:hypothetical protein